MTQRETIDTTYADLRPTDLVIDKSGQAWPVTEIRENFPVDRLQFWLCDPVTGVKMHQMEKDRDLAVKVSRLSTQADEASKLEADFPQCEHEWTDSDPAHFTKGLVRCRQCGEVQSRGTLEAEFVKGEVIVKREDTLDATMAEAVAAVEAVGGTVEADFPPLTDVEIIKPENKKPGDVVVASVPDAALGATMAVVRESAWTTESIEAGVATIKEFLGGTVEAEVTATVGRLSTSPEEQAELQEKFPKDWAPAGTVNDSFLEEAVAAVEEIGGTVAAEVTAAEVDAAAAATDDAPISLPPFADMTPLEQRSHLYLLHGLYGSDVTGKAELIAIHEQAHAQHAAGTLNSRHVPHVHLDLEEA